MQTLKSEDIMSIDGKAYDIGYNTHILITVEDAGVMVIDLYDGPAQAPEYVGQADNFLGSIKINAPAGDIATAIRPR